MTHPSLLCYALLQWCCLSLPRADLGAVVCLAAVYDVVHGGWLDAVNANSIARGSLVGGKCRGRVQRTLGVCVGLSLWCAWMRRDGGLLDVHAFTTC